MNISPFDRAKCGLSLMVLVALCLVPFFSTVYVSLMMRDFTMFFFDVKTAYTQYVKYVRRAFWGAFSRGDTL